ncbi:TIR-like protein DUF1863 [Stutzerimonas stutzeri]|jgi:hypothetical protein|uniref:TIR-like protein DUF1863 n=2 Tax=Stutzerimonas stutzeri TaxID=316 RepID=A0A5S5B4Y2_STUST|nr:TIR-like protein DUF1863 [Stutzerimonas stutzeri]
MMPSLLFLENIPCGRHEIIPREGGVEMGYKNPAYVVFDGDEDGWAYRFMRGWKANEHVEFDFRDAHDLDNMTSRAQGEQYVKRHLRDRMSQSSCIIVLVGEKTKNLYKYVRWEIELAISLDLPIIGVNLNCSNGVDKLRCPALLRDHCAVHVPFKLAAIKFALDYWPNEYHRLGDREKGQGARSYPAEKYQEWTKS